MTTLIEKIATNKSFYNGIRFEQINKGIFNVDESVKKTFAHSLKVAELFGVANAYISDKSAKLELQAMNIEGDKYKIFESLFNLKSTQIKLYIAISKIPSEVVTEFRQSENRQTLEELKKYANKTDTDTEESETEVKEKSENLKISVTKDNKISIKGKATKQVLTLLIEELKKLMAEEKTPTNVKESKAA